MPRVSVVVRTKDRPGLLRRALKDVVAQTFDDWEIIVVNDGGDGEETRAIAAGSPAGSRVNVIDTAGEGGRCAAANAGIRAAESDYVVLHDDDDRWAPEFLARTTDWLGTHPAAAGVMVSTTIVYEEQRDDEWVEVGRAPFWEGMSRLSLIELLEVNRAVPISFLYRRSLHDLVGWYDESLEAVEDWEFYLRVAATQEVGFLDGPSLAYWTQRPNATGAEANSMFRLQQDHERDDSIVRDRALRAWIEQNGPGLPLYIAQIHKQLRDEFSRELSIRLEQQRADIVREIYDRHPVWRRLRALRRRPRNPPASNRT